MAKETISATRDGTPEELTEETSISAAFIVALLEKSLSEGKTIEIPSLKVEIRGEGELSEAEDAEALDSHC